MGQITGVRADFRSYISSLKDIIKRDSCSKNSVIMSKEITTDGAFDNASLLMYISALRIAFVQYHFRVMNWCTQI